MLLLLVDMVLNKKNGELILRDGKNIFINTYMEVEGEHRIT